MKKLLYIFTLVCTTVACSKSDQPVVGGYPADGVVRIVPTVAAPLTRAEQSTEFKGSRLGLGLYYGEDDKYNRASSLWKKDKDGKWGTSGTSVLWKDAETEVAVYAFVPYVETDNSYIYTGSDFNVYVPDDQSSGLEEADMLWYSKKVKPGEALDQDGCLNIELKHALLKLTVNLNFGNEFGDSKPSIKEVWLNGTAKCVACFLNKDGLLSQMGTTPIDIRMHNPSEYCYEAIFYPSTGQKEGGDMLTVILSDGSDYRLTLSEDLALDKDPNGNYLGGCAYSMDVKIGKNKIESVDISIISWEKGTDNDPLDVEEVKQ